MANPAPQIPDTLDPRNLNQLSEEVCREIIAKYRGKLDWILHIPELEKTFAEGVSTLGLPGARKGVNRMTALGSLLIQNKYELITWAFDHFRGNLDAAVAERLDQKFGANMFVHRNLDLQISSKRWIELRDKVSFAMSAEHRRYKHAQAVLFFQCRERVEAAVNRLVFDPSRKADATQEGCIGLLHAIDRVSVDGAQSLGGYAYAWIQRHIRNYLLGQKYPVHVPANLAAKCTEENQATLGTSGKQSDRENRLRAIIFERLRQPSVSIEELFEHGGDGGLDDANAEDPRDALMRKDLCELVDFIIAELTEKQREVVEMRYGFGDKGAKTLVEIAEAIGISHQQVSMREKRALQKIEQALTPILKELYG